MHRRNYLKLAGCGMLYRQTSKRIALIVVAVLISVIIFGGVRRSAQERRSSINLPTSKILMLPAPGKPRRTNGFPTAAAISPDGRYLAMLNNGYGTAESRFQQSIAVMNLNSHRVNDYPDARLGQGAHQTYFLGLAFSPDGEKLYASMSSMTDPEGERPGDTGNGIAIYRFEEGRVSPKSFLKIPLAPLGREKRLAKAFTHLPEGKAVPFPAGISVVNGRDSEELLVAEILSDDAILMDARSGRIIYRFPLSDSPLVPSVFPHSVAATRDGKKGFCSLWNDSAVAELDLTDGRVVRRIWLDSPKSPLSAGSHPTAMLLSPDEARLYVTLTNSDRVAVVNAASGKVMGTFSTKLPGQKYGGSSPVALALSADGKRLFVADANADAVAAFDTSMVTANMSTKALGFIPTEWYPTALAVKGDALFILTGKGTGTGPNSKSAGPLHGGSGSRHSFIASLLYGSVADYSVRDAMDNLPTLTHEVQESNLMLQSRGEIRFAVGGNPIRHIIYIIKENRTYDQIFGDIEAANGDPSLTLYGEDITPNEHKLARQFGILDNFYCSGEVSNDGHIWSTAAVASDYQEMTWPIAYRGREWTPDYEGVVMDEVPLRLNEPDVDEPGTGFIWANVARHGLTHRNYGEYVVTHWCRDASPKIGQQLTVEDCAKPLVRHGEPLPPNVGAPPGSPSPWPWPIPMISHDDATKPELESHFDPRFADFNLAYPDQTANLLAT